MSILAGRSCLHKGAHRRTIGPTKPSAVPSGKAGTMRPAAKPLGRPTLVLFAVLFAAAAISPVSYTHLTLPTIYSV